jgi:hypothetical protein
MASRLPTETFRELARLVVLTAAEGKSAVEVHGGGCQLTYDEALTFEGTGFDPDDPDYVEIVRWLGIPERSRASMR